MTNAMNRSTIGPCPLCKTEKREKKISVDKELYMVVQCPQCGLAQTFPSPKDEDLNLHGFAEYYGQNRDKFIPAIQNIRQWFMNKRASTYFSFLPTKDRMPSILDIGCAEGRLLKAFLGKGCCCYGIEQKKFPESRFLCKDQIFYFKGELEDIGMPAKSFDMIFIWHVLEHVDSPNSVISKAFELLVKNGVLVIALPNFSSLEARAFKDNWFHLDIPWHRYHFTRRTINNLMEQYDFNIIKSSTFCLEQGVYGIIQSTLNFMGWPKNEFYEFIKGSTDPHRLWAVLVQFFIILWLIVPCFIITLLTSWIGKGSILKLVFTK